MKSTVQTVLDNLRNHGAVSDTAEKVYAATDRTKRAGVLIALVLDKETDQVHVILTKRSLQLRTHAGEVALPGGRMDEQDADIAATALREAHEEIGLHPDHVDILSYHDPAISLHKLVVTPVCGIIKDSLLSSSAAPSKASATVSTLASSISKDEDSTSLSIHTSTPSTPHNASNSVQILQSLTSNPTEVSSLFTTQLSTFLSTSGHTAQRFDLDGRVWRGHAFEVASGGQEYTVWGLTAQVLVAFARVALGRAPEFDDAFSETQAREELHSLLTRGVRKRRRDSDSRSVILRE